MSRPYEEVRYATDEEWRRARLDGVGGSDVAAIMGLNKWRSPLEVWLEKTGRAEPPDLSGKQSVEWGVRLEPLIAAKFAECHPEMRVRRKNCTMVSVARPWARANIDRELVGPLGRGVLEIKSVGLRSADEWVYGVPPYYEAQIQHYLSVTGWRYSFCAVLIGGQDYREHFVPRDEDDIASIDRAVDGFWNGFVMTGTMPQMTGLGDEGNALASLHPVGEEYLKLLDADMPELGERALLNVELEGINSRKRELDSLIKAAIGDHRGIETESVRATWVRKRDGRDGGLRFSPARE